MADYALFLALTFGISLVAFWGIYRIPGANAPEGLIGLPIWLLAIWSPTIAAVLLAYRDGNHAALLKRAIDFATVPAIGWLMAVSPILILVILCWRKRAVLDFSEAKPSLLVMMIGMNLIMGPVGEELGWRGYMQGRLEQDIGWLGASFVVGAIWFVWHLPLWLVNSPQKEIPVLIFGGHVFAYAFAMGAIQHVVGSSLVPVIVFHLAVNVVSGWAVLVSYGSSETWYRNSLIPFGVLAGVAAIITIL